ncbi:protein neprosin-like [Aristolochia californica]|uniref:protein neprosin-like n=1 Tax=Aristolochia californica TaxID=171875 RepID=UPI0035D7A851
MAEITISNDEYGVVFDCVAIHKQPSLDHPLLKDFKMDQLLEPEFGREENKSKASTMKIESSDEVCPVGTVPIRRIQMEELLRAGSVSNFLRRGYADSSLHEYATERLSGGVYLGTKATLNIWQPKVDDDKFQSFSLAQIWLTKGSGEERNSIEVGWHVYPFWHREKDEPTAVRLFTLWTNNNYKTWHYNDDGGFLVKSQTWSPGMVLPSSNMDGMEELVGVWPANLFTNLATGGADTLTWGGEVTRRQGGLFPAMGSGQFSNKDYTKSAYVKRIYLVDAEGTTQVIPDAKDLYISESLPDCFKVEDKGYDGSEGGYGRHFLYGGPGEESCPVGSSISDA